MGKNEILTLQFGHYANFVGTHWWNLQEQGFEYNTTTPSEIYPDVLYREGITNKVIVKTKKKYPVFRLGSNFRSKLPLRLDCSLLIYMVA